MKNTNLPITGPYTLGEVIASPNGGELIEINSPAHGGFASVVWKMECEESSPECQATAKLIADSWTNARKVEELELEIKKLKGTVLSSALGRKSYLEGRTTYKEVFEWKLHWLYCDLLHTEVKCTMASGAENMFQFLNENNWKFQRLVHDFAVMVGFDIYESDLLKEIYLLEKYKVYEDKFLEMMQNAIAIDKKISELLLKNKFEKCTNNFSYDLKKKIVV